MRREEGLSKKKALLVFAIIVVLLGTIPIVCAIKVDTYTVMSGQALLIKVDLDDQDFVNCTFGDDPIHFYVTNQQDVTVLDLGQVNGIHTINFTAQGAGQYILHFENPVPIYASVVTVVLDAPSKGIPFWIALILFAVVGLVVGLIVTGIIVFVKRRRRQASNSPST